MILVLGGVARLGLVCVGVIGDTVVDTVVAYSNKEFCK